MVNLSDSKTYRCISCDTSLYGEICHNCGQKVLKEPWSINLILRQFIQQLTNVERGFIFTSLQLFAEPSKVIREYWKGMTIKYYNPFRFVLIWTAVNLLINFWIGIDDMLQDALQPQAIEEAIDSDTLKSADQKFDAWLNIMVLLLIPVFGYLTKILFARKTESYAKHVLMNSFIMGQQSLITSFTHFVFYFFPALFVIYIPFNFLIGVVYNSYVFKKMYNQNILLTIGKAILIGIVGLVVFGALVFLFSTAAIIFS